MSGKRDPIGGKDGEPMDYRHSVVRSQITRAQIEKPGSMLQIDGTAMTGQLLCGPVVAKRGGAMAA